MNRTTERTIEMLEIISRQKHGIDLKEITKAMGIPKSSAFDILHTLIELKVVFEKEGSEKKYVIGSKAFEIGSAFILDMDLISKARFELEELAEKVNRTAYIAIIDDLKILYIYKYQATKAKITASNVGSRNDIYNTSLGKAMLAFLKKEQQVDMINRFDFVATTHNTITDKNHLMKELETIQKVGYSVDNREQENHMICFGAPIFDYTGKVLAGISISGLYEEDLSFDFYGELIKETAAKISAKLGKI